MKRPRGLTLIEVLVALAILGLVLGTVAASIGSSLEASRQSRLQALATEYAQAVVERYRVHWSSPASYQAGSTPPSLSELNSRLAGAGLSASIDASGQINPDGSAFTGTGQPPLRRVVVEVRQGTRLRARVATEIGNPQTSGLR